MSTAPAPTLEERLAAEDRRRAEKPNTVNWWDVHKLEKIAQRNPQTLEQGLQRGIFLPDGRVDSSRPEFRRYPPSRSG